MTSAVSINPVKASPASDAIYRAVIAEVLRSATPKGDEKFLARDPDDKISPVVHRAVTSLGAAGTSGWAAEIVETAVHDFIVSMGPRSAAARLLALSLQAPIPSRAGYLRVPGIVAGPSGGFVGEGEPIPVAAMSFSAAELARKKIAIIANVSREVAKSSNAETHIRNALTESAALTLDHVLFSSTAATQSTPAGLLHGLSPIAPGSFDADPMVNDLTSLAAAVAPIAGDRIAFAASPARALQIGLRYPNFRYPLLASSAIPDSRIVALALDALAVTAGVDPSSDAINLTVSSEAVLHMSDAPSSISDGEVAAPVRSFFQTDCVAIRLFLELDWSLRNAEAVAMLEGMAW